MVTPLLSIIIPTCNRAHLLAPTLTALTQVDLLLEVCVSDNASEDATQQVLASFASAFAALRVIRQPHRLTLIANHQAAMRLACTPYMLVIGDDDAICPQALLHVIGLLESDPSLSAVYGSFDIRDLETGAHRAFRRPTDQQLRCTQADRHRLFANAFMMECVVARTAIVQRYFAHSGRRHPLGWLFLDALIRHGDILLSPEVLVVKADFADRQGYRNYERWFQDLVHLDAEAFFARDDEPMAGRDPAADKVAQFLSISAHSAVSHGHTLWAAHFLERLNVLQSPHWPTDLAGANLTEACLTARMAQLAADWDATRLVVEAVDPLPALAARVPGVTIATLDQMTPEDVVVVARASSLDALAGRIAPGRCAALDDLAADLHWGSGA
ncbi:MAG: glycosyltransferase family 2 protein [Rhodospirillaceae bacterium]|nr:glycosyltransferase family 2 protein [Rhodospirillales bacterium]